MKKRLLFLLSIPILIVCLFIVYKAENLKIHNELYKLNEENQTTWNSIFFNIEASNRLIEVIVDATDNQASKRIFLEERRNFYDITNKKQQYLSYKKMLSLTDDVSKSTDLLTISLSSLKKTNETILIEVKEYNKNANRINDLRSSIFFVFENKMLKNKKEELL